MFPSSPQALMGTIESVQAAVRVLGIQKSQFSSLLPVGSSL